MSVIDLRQDPMAQMAMAENIGRTVGDFANKARKLSVEQKLVSIMSNPDTTPKEKWELIRAEQGGLFGATSREVQQFMQRPEVYGQFAGTAMALELYPERETQREREALAAARERVGLEFDVRKLQKIDMELEQIRTASPGGVLSPKESMEVAYKYGQDFAESDTVKVYREVVKQADNARIGLDRSKAGDRVTGDQMILVSLQRLLDPNSVVRTSEYARTAEGVALIDILKVWEEKILAGGAGVPIENLEDAVISIERMEKGYEDSYKSAYDRLDKIGDKYGLDKSLLFLGEVDIPTGEPIKKRLTVDEFLSKKKEEVKQVPIGDIPIAVDADGNIKIDESKMEKGKEYIDLEKGETFIWE